MCGNKEYSGLDNDNAKIFSVQFFFFFLLDFKHVPYYASTQLQFLLKKKKKRLCRVVFF